MKTLVQIINRLISENLHGATTFKPANHADPTVKGVIPSELNDGWVDVRSDYQDLDSKDPRWFDLFMEYFLSEEYSQNNDDLLFFVRSLPMESSSFSKSSSTHSVESEPIFVRRKVSNQLPTLNDIVCWKQTFFLNLIIQMPCVLTVAVCTKYREKESRIPQEQRILTFSSSSNIVTANTTNDNNISNIDTASPSTTQKLEVPSNSSRPKSKMTALKRITKKVYAAPYKSRMDVKDAFMSECSYPFIYYTVNDYESHDLHLSISENQYLCVELSSWISSSSASVQVECIPVEQDNSPFPIPEGIEKVVLFQGAVPYSSLLEVFQQKGNSTNHTAVGGPLWNMAKKRLSKDNLRSLFQPDDSQESKQRIEYIMMRGPHGKGQCQVAIQDRKQVSKNSQANSAHGSQVGLNVDTSVVTPTSSNSTGGDAHSQQQQQPQSQSSPSSANNQTPTSGFLVFSERLKSFSKFVSSQMNNVGTLLPDVVSSPSSEIIVTDLELDCSMTFVNVPWQSIVSDLMDFGKKSKPSIPTKKTSESAT